jgi:hypothetical protein
MDELVDKDYINHIKKDIINKLTTRFIVIAVAYSVILGLILKH